MSGANQLHNQVQEWTGKHHVSQICALYSSLYKNLNWLIQFCLYYRYLKIPFRCNSISAIFSHNTNKCLFDTWKYIPILLLHISASFMSSSWSFTPKLKTCPSMKSCKLHTCGNCNSYPPIVSFYMQLTTHHTGTRSIKEWKQNWTFVQKEKTTAYQQITVLQKLIKHCKNAVGSRFATVHFMIHFYDPCPVEPSTPNLWRITVATQESFLYLVCF